MLHKVNFAFFQVTNKLSAITCRASWQVQVEDIDLAKRLISCKRLHMDDSLSKIDGVHFFYKPHHWDLEQLET